MLLNISGVSFFAHVLINVFFFLKKRLFGNALVGVPSRAISSVRMSLAFSAAIVFVVGSTGLLVFGSVIYLNTRDSPSLAFLERIIDMPEVLAQKGSGGEQSVKDQGVIITKSESSKFYFDATGAPDKSNFIASNVSKNNAVSAEDAKLNDMPSEKKIFIETAKEKDNLRMVVYRLMLDYMGESPCLNKGDNRELCERMITYSLENLALEYLKLSGFASESGVELVKIEPGAQVYFGEDGKIKIIDSNRQIQKKVIVGGNYLIGEK